MDYWEPWWSCCYQSANDNFKLVKNVSKTVILKKKFKIPQKSNWAQFSKNPKKSQTKTLNSPKNAQSPNENFAAQTEFQKPNLGWKAQIWQHWLLWSDLQRDFQSGVNKQKNQLTLDITRKYPLRGYCLAPPGRRKRITLTQENTRAAEYSPVVTGYGYVRTDWWTERRGSWNISLDNANFASSQICLYSKV